MSAGRPKSVVQLFKWQQVRHLVKRCVRNKEKNICFHATQLVIFSELWSWGILVV